MKPIKYNPVVTVYIFERGYAPHILKVSVKSLTRVPVLFIILMAQTYLVLKIEVAPLKWHFPEKFTVTKMCAIDGSMFLRIFISIS
jgi:hypothetical protein